MLKSLMKKVRKQDILLLDNGFYGFKLFKAFIERGCHFIIPLNKNTMPKVVRKLGENEYIVEIEDSDRASKETLQFRMIYVYRKGYRRRRILTSLKDSAKYTLAEIATLYHQRWSVETFFRDFKSTMQACKWHCGKADTFKKELAMHMIAAVLIRRTMLQAAEKARVKPAVLSYSKALTEMRVFLRRIAGISKEVLQDVYGQFIANCARYMIESKPGRSYSRSKQEYRAKSRGLETTKKKKPPTQTNPYMTSDETIKLSGGITYALS